MTRWKKFLAVSCSHGDRIHRDAAKFVLDFKQKLRPDVTLHLGDFVDTAAFRRGAKGSSDEGASIGEDFDAGIDFLLKLEPNVILCGNHEHRLWALQNNPNAIVSHAAGSCIQQINETAATLKAKLYPYDLIKGWHPMGDIMCGHGYSYGESAVRDHAERMGCKVIMGHKHVVMEAPGRNIRQASGYCVGMLADIDKMDYARQRFATLGWSMGFAYGEYCDSSSFVHLVRLPVGQPWRMPLV